MGTSFTDSTTSFNTLGGQLTYFKSPLTRNTTQTSFHTLTKDTGGIIQLYSGKQFPRAQLFNKAFISHLGKEFTTSLKHASPKRERSPESQSNLLRGFLSGHLPIRTAAVFENNPSPGSPGFQHFNTGVFTHRKSVIPRRKSVQNKCLTTHWALIWGGQPLSGLPSHR